jgi:hypothetical protein
MPEVDSEFGGLEDFALVKEKVIHNGGNLDLPSLSLKHRGFSHSRRMDKITCEGYTFTNK